VVARLEGTGNVPTKLSVPQQHGVEWLEPTVAAEVEPRGSIVGGHRSFTYVIKLTEPGEVALGKLSLPYWDPDARAYRTASTDLGSVTVKPSAAQKKRTPVAKTPLETLGKARPALGEYTPAGPAVADRPVFWALLFGAPLSVLLADGGRRLGSFLSRRRQAQKNDPRELSGRALAEARRLLASDPTAAVAQVERALFLALEGGLAVKARALLKAVVKDELERAGLLPEHTDETQALLEECEGARFTGKSASTEGDLLGRATRLLPRRGGLAEALRPEWRDARGHLQYRARRRTSHGPGIGHSP
jgi:hypothetical protein